MSRITDYSLRTLVVGQLIHESPKAYLIEYEGNHKRYWLPKRLCQNVSRKIVNEKGCGLITNLFCYVPSEFFQNAKPIISQ